LEEILHKIAVQQRDNGSVMISKDLDMSMENEMIYFAFQNWNIEYDWWAPNMIPADLVIDGKKRPPYSHGLLWFFDTVPLHGINIDDFAEFSAKKSDFLYNHGGVYYAHLPDLRNQKYIFPVCIRDSSFFNDMKNYGFSFVDPQVFEDVKQDRARIVFIFPYEGTSGIEYFDNDFKILNDWCVKNNLEKHQVFYIHANQKGELHSRDMHFTYIPIDCFSCWIPELRNKITNFDLSDDQKLFLCYNRQPKIHRTLTVCELIKENLFDQGIISYYGNEFQKTEDSISSYGRMDLIPSAKILDSLTPLELDIKLKKINPAGILVQEHYQKTFLSLVTESLIDNNSIFFSEKTWKPIALGHPFMMVGSPGMLAELRKQGFYTFGSWWDESYDNETNLDKCIHQIVNELKRLSTYSLEELQNMRASMIPVLQHNQEKFNQSYKENCSNSHERGLYNVVKDIWNSF
jgi:hypothetical protein